MLFLSSFSAMRALICVAVLALSVLADKEYPEEQGDNILLSPKLWQAIQKRLQDYGYDALDDLSADLDDPLCSTHEVMNNTIIRTRDSQAAGATYIDSPRVNSREECLAECCAEETCNIAVFKEKKNNHTCYLFDCGTPNICLFTAHPGYSVVKFPSRTTSNKQLEKHENDLQNLATEPTTTTTTTEATTPEAINEPVPLFSKCRTDADCAVLSSECIENYCLCSEGSHEQEGVCRKDCNKFEFECRNVGQPLMYPQCVAIYNKCDGMALCKDKSDEQDCDSDKEPISVSSSDNDDIDDSQTNDEQDSDEQSRPQTGDKIAPPPAQWDTKDDKSSQDVDDSDSDQTSEDNENGDQSSSLDSDGQKKVKVIDMDDGDDTSEQSIGHEKSDNEKTESTDEQTSSEEDQPIKNDENADEKNVQDSLSQNSEIMDMEDTQVIAIKAEEMTADENTFSRFYQTNRGAVVALALGLAITALLLIFVGCRLRNVKKRLRKGRPLNSNEADYLINGMYL